MGKHKATMMMSLDGFTAGPEQSAENPRNRRVDSPADTDGIEAALELAQRAAGGSDVSLGGGTATVQRCMATGLADELLLSRMPLFLGNRTRLFANLDATAGRLQQVEAVAAPGVMHIRYLLTT